MFHTYFRFLRHSFFFGIVGMDNGVIVSLKGSDSVIKQYLHLVPPPTIGFVDGTDHLTASQESVPLIV